MNMFEFLGIAVLAISITGAFVIDRVFGSGRHNSQMQLQLAEQHIRELLARLSELERHNEELREQLEWNRKLLEAQDHVLQQLGPPASPPPLSRV